ncbi:hypothetical protein LBMAG53_38850 [Planctomycetota bacterium]|nr:hypothetical protein LBMAG53_38850 [Planctomycetota bacterium]
MATDRHSVQPDRQQTGQRVDLVDLLRRLASDDREQDWITFIQYQAPIIAAVCRGHLKQENLVEDAVQETILAIRDGLATLVLVDDRSAQAWITTIAGNIACNLFNRERVREHHQHRYAGERVPIDDDATENLDDLEETQCRISTVMDAIRNLPELQRRVIELRYFHDLDHESIAVRLNLSQENVRATLSRSLARLRRDLPVGAGSSSIVAILRDVGMDPHLSEAAFAGASGGMAGGTTVTTTAGASSVMPSVVTFLFLSAALVVAAFGAMTWLYPIGKPVVAPQESSGLLVLRSTGPVQCRQDPGPALQMIAQGQILPPGSRILTGTGGEIVFGLHGGGELIVRDEGDLEITGPSAGVKFTTGNLVFSWPETAQPGQAIRIQTPHGSLRISGGRGYLMACPYSARVDLLAGRARLDAVSESNSDLPAGKAALLVPGKAPLVVPSWGQEFSPRWGGMYYRDAAVAYVAGRSALDGLVEVGQPISAWPKDREYAVPATGGIDAIGMPFKVADLAGRRVLSIPIPPSHPSAFTLVCETKRLFEQDELEFSTSWSVDTTPQGIGVAGLDWPRPVVFNPSTIRSKSQTWHGSRISYRQVGRNYSDQIIYEFRIAIADRVFVQRWQFGAPVGFNFKVQGAGGIHIRNLRIVGLEVGP